MKLAGVCHDVYAGMCCVIVYHAIATDGGVGGVLDHGLCLGWIHVSVSAVLRSGWWSGSHCVWIHPMVCLVVST